MYYYVLPCPLLDGGMWKVLVLVLLVSSIACGEAQRCQQGWLVLKCYLFVINFVPLAAGLGSYALNRSPSSSGDPLAGGNTVGGCVNDNGVYRCIPRGSTVVQLVDGELGAVMSSNVNNSTIHAWSRSTGRVEITYTFIDSLSIRNFNLFFYNVPSMGIGLPNIELFAGTTSTTPLPYFLTGNQDISRDDNGRRNVTLSLLEQSQSIRFYRVEFDFADTDIDWLILSEMVLCSDLLGMSRIDCAYIALSILCALFKSLVQLVSDISTLHCFPCSYTSIRGSICGHPFPHRFSSSGRCLP